MGNKQSERKFRAGPRAVAVALSANRRRSRSPRSASMMVFSENFPSDTFA